MSTHRRLEAESKGWKSGAYAASISLNADLDQ